MQNTMKKILIDDNCSLFLIEALSKEMYAHNMYIHLANKMRFAGFFGAQSFFEKESQDELEHYKKIATFLSDMGVDVSMDGVSSCDDSAKTLNEAFDIAYQAELELLNFYKSGYSNLDPVCQEFVLGFIKIQRKSVGEYSDLITRLDIIGSDQCGFIIFDNELKK